MVGELRELIIIGTNEGPAVARGRVGGRPTVAGPSVPHLPAYVGLGPPALPRYRAPARPLSELVGSDPDFDDATWAARLDDPPAPVFVPSVRGGRRAELTYSSEAFDSSRGDIAHLEGVHASPQAADSGVFVDASGPAARPFSSAYSRIPASCRCPDQAVLLVSW